MNAHRTAPTLLVATVLALAATSTPAADAPTSIPLRWAPSSADGGIRPGAVDLAPFAGVRVRVDLFADQREGEPAQLGERTDKEGMKTAVVTEDSVPEFVTERVLAAFERLGLPLVDERLLRKWGAELTPRTAPVVRLKGEVLSLRVVEAETLEAEARIGVIVEDAEGVPIWSGSSAGRAGRQARKYSLTDWQETISDALAEAIAQLARSEDFVRALSGRRQ